MKIREMTIPYSGKLTREREREMKTFLEQIDFAQQLYEESKSSVIGDILEDLKHSFAEYRRYQNGRTIFTH